MHLPETNARGDKDGSNEMCPCGLRVERCSKGPKGCGRQLCYFFGRNALGYDCGNTFIDEYDGSRCRWPIGSLRWRYPGHCCTLKLHCCSLAIAKHGRQTSK